MKLNPIIPIGLMVVISITLICVTIFVNLKSKKNKKISILLRIIAILLLFTINLRPMVYVGEEEIVLNDLDVLLVVDTSISMSGKDMESGRKSRLEKVKEDATQIINSLAGSRFALITFDNYGKIMIPFTSDARSVLDAVDALNVKDYYMANPSNPSFALTSMNEVLQRNGDNRQRVVFFFSDGEPTDGKNVESFSGLNKFINNGAVLGYGTKQGSKLYYSPNYNVNEVRVIKDPTNNLGMNESDLEHNLKADDNPVIRAAYIHILGDMIQSTGVLLAALVIYLFQDTHPGVRILDPICTFGFAIVVLCITFPVSRDCFYVLLESTPRDLDIDSLYNDLSCIKGVISVHDIHLWNISIGRPSIALHIICDNPNEILKLATQKCKDYGIKHCTIQTETLANNCQHEEDNDIH